jgi:hypothetical protein
MRRTVKTYYDFGETGTLIGEDLLSKSAWDTLRTSGLAHFSVAADRDGWLASFAEREDLRERANAIVSLCRANDCTRVFSVGVGVAGLEYFMKTESPGLHLTCTDYAPAATERLADVFSECDEVRVFDMMSEPWPSTPGTLYLLHRVDTELSDRQWRECFRRMTASRVSPVLVIPCAFLTPEWRAATRSRFSSRFRRRKHLTFSGYLRTKSRFMSLWSPSYALLEELQVGDLTGFLLQARA